jgi:cell division protein FtsB
MRRRRMRRPPRDYAIAGVLLVVFLSLVWGVVGLVGKEERARKAAREAKAELASLSEREESLKKSLAELATPRGQEASLRETYGVARPGEEVIIVVTPGEGEELEELAWWRKFLGFFGL